MRECTCLTVFVVGEEVTVYGNGGIGGAELVNIAWPIYLGQQHKGSLALQQRAGVYFSFMPPPALIPRFQCCLSLIMISIQLWLSTPFISSPFCTPSLNWPQAGPMSKPAPRRTKASLCISAHLIRLVRFSLLVSSFYSLQACHILFPIQRLSVFFLSTIILHPHCYPTLISKRATVICFARGPSVHRKQSDVTSPPLCVLLDKCMQAC